MSGEDEQVCAGRQAQYQDEDEFEMVDHASDASSTSSFELVGRQEQEQDEQQQQQQQQQQGDSQRWDSELIPHELGPMARTLYLIYVMCKKYPRLDGIKSTLKDMWCEGDERLMTAVSYIESGQPELCASQLEASAREYSDASQQEQEQEHQYTLMQQQEQQEQRQGRPRRESKVDLQRHVIESEIEAMRGLFGLTSKSVSELVSYFQYEAADCGGCFDRSQLGQLLARIVDIEDIDIDGGAGNQAEAHAQCIDRLFVVLDAEKKGVVQLHALCICISLLCEGTALEKVKVAFDLLDSDNDRLVTKAEMEAYFCVVFHVLFELAPGAAEAAEFSPAVIAKVTANSLFKEADANGDGSVTWEEFKEWYPSAQQAMSL